MTGLNAAGDFVGFYCNDIPCTTTPDHAFVQKAGVFTTIDPPGTDQAIARAINDAGAIVIQGYFGSVGVPFLRDSAGNFTQLNLPGPNGQAFGMNNVGRIVGSYFPAGISRGFIYSNGNALYIDHPDGANGTVPWDINDAGQVSGFYFDSNNRPHGFLYDGGSWTPIDDPLGVNGTFPQGLNNAGQIVGVYIDAFGASHGFLADPPVLFVGVKGNPNCVGQSVSFLANKYGGMPRATAALNYEGVQALQKAIKAYCR